MSVQGGLSCRLLHEVRPLDLRADNDSEMAKAKNGIAVAGLHGRLGNVVLQRAGEGLVVREMVVPYDPRTPAQLASRNRMQDVAAYWSRLGDAERAAWAEFAPERTYQAYLGLTSKWLARHPGEEPPTMPPGSPFFGDAVEITLLDPEPGRLVVRASRANAPDVATEILVQRLAGRWRKPREEKYRFAAFLTFTPDGLTQRVLLSPGAYAVAYRFLRTTSGQCTAFARLASLNV